MNSVQSGPTSTFKRFLALGLMGAAALGFSAAAQARGDVHWSVGIGSPGISVGVGSGVGYYPPQPVYAPPPVVYRGPQPVYMAPPVYYQPPPRVVYQPAPVYYVPVGPRGHHKHEWRARHGRGHGHGHGHGHWR